MKSEIQAYCHARKRCTNPNYPRWKDYGGRGIEFRFKSFEEFYAELGPRPKGLVLDRKDNDGHYEKGNVRWATRSESQKNRRFTEEIRKHQRIAIHFRWHVRRSIVNLSCEFCKEAQNG